MLSASSQDDTIAWYRNSGGAVPAFTRVVITNTADGASDVFAIDLDGDGDQDVISSSTNDDTIAWYENDGAASPSFTEHILTTLANGASSVFAADLDGDSDLDVVSAASTGFEIAWYESNGAADPSFTRIVVSTTQNRPRDVRADDLDDDGDLDIVVASTNEDKIVWLRNNGAFNPTFTEQIIADGIDGPQAIDVVDLDGDGDLDVVCAAISDDLIAWFESDGASTPTFTQWTIELDANGALGIDWADFNNDGAPDLVSAWANASRVALHRGARVTNEDTLESFGTITEAILGSSAGQSLLAEEEHFAESCELSINFLGRALTLRSVGAVDRSGLTATTMADGSAIESALSMPVTFFGILDVPPGADSMMLGDDVTIAGPLFLGVNAELVAGPNLVVAGLANLIQREISLNANGARGVYNADIDDDGDLDVLAALEQADQIVWYENLGGSNPQFGTRVIDTTADGATRVFVIDLDGDGDLDVLSSAMNNNTIAWHRNNGGGTPTFTKIVIDNNAMGALSVHADDIDLDGDIDVFSASQDDDSIAWYRSDGAPSPSFTKVVITNLADGASDVFSADLDDDGDIDLMSSAITGFEIAWYENNGAPSPSFVRRVISTSQNRPRDVHAADLDNDGDLDVISASTNEDRIAWFRNDGNQDPSFTEFFVTEEIDGPESIDVADLDNDGDLDVACAAISGDLIAWFENTGGSIPVFTQHVIRTRLNAARSVAIGDLDGDDDLDISLAATSSDSVTWYQNGLNSDIALQSLFASLRGIDTLRLNNKRIFIEQTVELGAGIELVIDDTSAVSGGGDLVAPSIRNAGELIPALGGSLQLDGDYAQTYDDPSEGLRAGVIRIDLAPLPGNTGVEITGTASLGGGLLVNAPSGFVPQVNQTLAPFLTSSTLVGGAAQFDVVLSPVIELDDGGTLIPGTLVPVYSNPGEPGQASLTAVPLEALLFSTNQFTLSGEPNDAKIADVSGAVNGLPDGIPDLVIAIPSIDIIAPQGAVAVLFGDVSGGGFSFSEVALYTSGVIDAPTSVEVGDFDFNGIQDIVYANSGQNGINNDVHFLIADSSMPAPVMMSDIPSLMVPDNASVTDLEVGEVLLVGFNRDDLLIGVRDPTQSTLRVSTYNSVFSEWTTCEVDVDDIDTVDVAPSSVARERGFIFDDLIALSSPLTDTIRVFRVENGDVDNAMFTDFPAGVDPRDLLFGLLDDDVFPDIVAINQGDDLNQGSLTVLRGGAVAFAPPVTIPLSGEDDPNPSPGSISLADLDGDADLDIVIIANNEIGERVVRELRNLSVQGGGAGVSFAQPEDLEDQPMGSPLIVRSSDLDGDSPGIPDDLVILVDASAQPRGDTGTQNVIQLSGMSMVCVPDLTGDGELNFFDISAFLTAFNAMDPIADINGDTQFNFFDVSMYLQLFLNGCP